MSDSSKAIIDASKIDVHEPTSLKMWNAIQNGATIPIYDVENIDEKLGEINLASVVKGEALMKEKSPEHYNNIITENDDAETADVWFQYCVLGDIVYG